MRINHCVICGEDWFPQNYYEPEEPCVCGHKLNKGEWRYEKWGDLFGLLLDYLSVRTAKIFWAIGSWVWEWRFE